MSSPCGCQEEKDIFNMISSRELVRIGLTAMVLGAIVIIANAVISNVGKGIVRS